MQACHNLREFIVRCASKTPDAPALMSPDCSAMNYGQLLQQIDQVTAQLAGMGITRGDRVAIVLPNGSEMAVMFLAVASMAVAAPLNPAYRAPEFDFYLADLRAKALIVLDGGNSPAIAVATSRGLPILRVVPERQAAVGTLRLVSDSPTRPITATLSEPADEALVLHTSGTTSRPKRVPLTQANLCASARNIRDWLALSPADRCLNVMPLFHIHGLVAALLSSLAGGGSVVCTEGFIAPQFMDWLKAVRPTWYTAVPTMHQAILARAQNSPTVLQDHSLRFIRSSSSALPPQVAEGLEHLFHVPVVEAYGMTEAAHQMCSNPLPPRPRKFGSVGLPAGPEVAIMDDTGNLRPAGAPGEVVIRGENVTPGYDANPEANASAFTHGWFRTGDSGHIDPDGYLYLSGRIKEIINRGGEKISPREIDEVLLDHPAVAAALTFAMPDSRLGEEIAAAVVLRPGASATEHDLAMFAAGRLADFKIPRRIVLLDELPKGPTGKPQRIGLARRLGLDGTATGAAARSHVDPQTPMEVALAGLWREVLHIDKVGQQDNFIELGGDSILAAQVIARVHQQLGRDLPMLTFFQSPTLSTMAKALEQTAPPDAVAAADPAELERLLAEVEAMPEEQAAVPAPVVPPVHRGRHVD
jgi:oxalate---CoA ligase